MGWRLAKSLAVLRDEVDRRWPGRAITSDGSIGDAAHSSRRSDHNPDRRGVVRAIDVTQWDPATPHDPHDDVAEVVAEHLRRTRDPRVKYVIWRGRMFSSYATSTSPAWQWRHYSGPNGHFTHVHISVVADDRADETRPWGLDRPSVTAPAEEDDVPLSNEDVEKVADRVITKLLNAVIPNERGPLSNVLHDVHVRTQQTQDTVAIIHQNTKPV